MAVTRDPFAFYVTTTIGTSTSGNTCTVAVTPAFPDSCDRMLVIAIGCTDALNIDNTIASVQVGGVSATLAKYKGGVSDVSLYYFPQPPRGTHNVVVTFNAANVIAVVIVNELEQMDPTDALGQTASNQGTAANDTLTLTTSDLDTSLCLQAIAAFGGGTNITVTPVSPYSNTGTTQVGATPNRTRVGCSAATRPGGASVSTRYNISTSKPFAHVAAEFRAARLLPLGSMMGMGF